MDQLKNKLPTQVYDALINANLKTLSTILTHNKCELANVTKLDLKIAETILRESSVILLSNKLKTANQILPWQRLCTGCLSIDKITNGGMALNRITEIVGCSGVGKTQLCLQLSLMTQLPPDFGGLGKSVVYICTEDAFPAKRLAELSKFFTEKYSRHNLNINFEDNIFLEHIADFEQLKCCIVQKLPKLFRVKKIGLIVIDSIAGVFRSENCDVNYANRSKDFILLVSELNNLSLKGSLAIICVNQVTDNIVTEVTEPCLGLAWSNLITCRFKINRYVMSEIREFEVVLAPDLPSEVCQFKITREGLIAVE